MRVSRSGIVAKIRYSPDALNDLEEIGDYIADTLKSPIAALNTVGNIQAAVDGLADFPLIGPPLSSISEIETDYRFLVCGNYLVFYRLKEDGVYVVRVVYGKRDYTKILFGNMPDDGPEPPEQGKP